ncbi:ABC transporter permease [Robertmurraya kyonggiensis]|uniref:ABC transporter permease n=1 Tax=Robertmurraya kyonggiensis TaxID=1037680 RepID=A0A4U1D0S0_9BACI|nr:ABC transporter permease subunit [Robertmurraya kyonggiensis]TKC15273.1 ABC transporter permease [Robertmurraya kyonggiensis]
MKNYLTLLQKELTESFRNGKWIWLPIAFMIIGITQPITTYYMPQILENAGNIPEGTVIEIPTPSGVEVLASTLSQYGMIGSLLFVLSAMGVIDNERQNGALTLVMVRPVTAIQYIASKWTGQVLIALTSFLLSYGLTFYYTNLLFEQVKWELVITSFLIYSLWIIFIFSVTILAGTFIKSASGISAVSISFVGGLSVISNLFTKFTTWSPTNLRTHASAILMEGKLMENSITVIMTTIGLSLLLLLIATFQFRRLEQY